MARDTDRPRLLHLLLALGMVCMAVVHRNAATGPDLFVEYAFIGFAAFNLTLAALGSRCRRAE